MESENTILITLGMILILTPLIRSFCKRLSIPALVGYVGLGLMINVLDLQWPLRSPAFESILSVLAQLGIVSLLFRVGLKSHIHALLAKLPDATLVWVGDVSANLALGFVSAYYLFDLGLMSSLIVAAAFSATSLAVTAAVWDEMNALDTPNGQLLIDVAELDDLSGIVILAVLLAVIPALVASTEIDLIATAGEAGFWALLKLLLFFVGCYVFALYIEPSFTRFNSRWDSAAGLTIAVLGAGLAIAAVAGYLGFSLAIGALFAGLAFSRDPEAVRVRGRFDNFYEFLTPFFFVQIGLQTNVHMLSAALGLGALLLVPAVLGKVGGVFLAARFLLPTRDAALIGLSMVPRAEIAMVIVYQCSLLGDDMLPPDVFGGLVFVCVATSVATPLALQRLLTKERI